MNKLNKKEKSRNKGHWKDKEKDTKKEVENQEFRNNKKAQNRSF